MAARRPFWKWQRWKSIGFCLWPPSTCIWNLQLKFQSKLDLCSGNHVVYRQTDGRTDGQTDGRTRWIQYTPPPTSLGGGIMSMKMLANMVHMWYTLRWSHVTGILQVFLINLKSLLTHRVNELIWKWLCPQWAWRCWQIWLICNTIWENAMLKLFCKFGPLKWNPCWLIMLNELVWH